MCRSSFKYNLTFIILFFGITLVHADPKEEKTSDNTKKILLYYTEWSAQCRSVMMIGKMLDVQFDLKELDLTEKREQHDPEFSKINPLHKVPTIDDDGYVLSESRAIMVYLVQTYAKGDDLSLFPTELKEQAKVNTMLNFDMDTLNDAFINLYSPWIFFKTPKNEYKQNELNVALGYLEQFLKTKFIAGDSLTVADVALVATIITIEAVGEDLTQYKKINEWLNNCKSNIPFFDEVNKKGLEEAKKMAKKAREEESKGEVADTVSNSDVHKAVQTLLNAVQTQVISTEHSKYLKPLLEFLTPLVKA